MEATRSRRCRLEHRRRPSEARYPKSSVKMIFSDATDASCGAWFWTPVADQQLQRLRPRRQGHLGLRLVAAEVHDVPASALARGRQVAVDQQLMMVRCRSADANVFRRGLFVSAFVAAGSRIEPPVSAGSLPGRRPSPSPEPCRPYRPLTASTLPGGWRYFFGRQSPIHPTSQATAERGFHRTLIGRSVPLRRGRRSPSRKIRSAPSPLLPCQGFPDNPRLSTGAGFHETDTRSTQSARR
jgi:hypothetical protein